MRIITENSVYTVVPVEGGFEVKRLASTRSDVQVRDKHRHFTPSLCVGIGSPLVTTNMRTTPVLAILPV